MPLHELSPRLPSTDARVPVLPNGRRPSWLVVAIILVAVLPALIALADDRSGLRLVMGALVVTIVGAAVCLTLLLGTNRDGLLRVDADDPALWFRPAPIVTAVPFLLGGILLLPGMAQAVVDAAGLPTMPSFLLTRAPYALALLGIGVLVMKALQLREPAGLRLTPEGLRGIRGRGHLEWTWDEIGEVGVGAGPVAMLTLVHNGDGPRIEAPMVALGSDPGQVAAIVRFFRDDPGARAVLGRGGDVAVRAVDDALSGRER